MCTASANVLLEIARPVLYTQLDNMTLSLQGVAPGLNSAAHTVCSRRWSVPPPESVLTCFVVG